jgi:hypothetical protein
MTSVEDAHELRVEFPDGRVKGVGSYEENGMEATVILSSDTGTLVFSCDSTVGSGYSPLYDHSLALAYLGDLLPGFYHARIGSMCIMLVDGSWWEGAEWSFEKRKHTECGEAKARLPCEFQWDGEVSSNSSSEYQPEHIEFGFSEGHVRDSAGLCDAISDVTETDGMYHITSLSGTCYSIMMGSDDFSVRIAAGPDCVAAADFPSSGAEQVYGEYWEMHVNMPDCSSWFDEYCSSTDDCSSSELCVVKTGESEWEEECVPSQDSFCEDDSMLHLWSMFFDYCGDNQWTCHPVCGTIVEQLTDLGVDMNSEEDVRAKLGCAVEADTHSNLGYWFSDHYTGLEDLVYVPDDCDPYSEEHDWQDCVASSRAILGAFVLESTCPTDLFEFQSVFEVELSDKFDIDATCTSECRGDLEALLESLSSMECGWEAHASLVGQLERLIHLGCLSDDTDGHSCMEEIYSLEGVRSGVKGTVIDTYVDYKMGRGQCPEVPYYDCPGLWEQRSRGQHDFCILPRHSADSPIGFIPSHFWDDQHYCRDEAALECSRALLALDCNWEQIIEGDELEHCSQYAECAEVFCKDEVPFCHSEQARECGDRCGPCMDGMDYDEYGDSCDDFCSMCESYLPCFDGTRVCLFVFLRYLPAAILSDLSYLDVFDYLCV